MHAEISKAIEVQSRRERAALKVRVENQRAFGGFCTELMRIKSSEWSPTIHFVAWYLGCITLKSGINSVVYSSLEDLTRAQGGAAFGGLGANDLSPALKVLKGFGIIKIDPKDHVEAAMPLWTLLVIADSAQWAVPANGWRWAAGELMGLMHERLCRQRHTPSLHGLAVEADLTDALAHVAAKGDAAASVSSSREVGEEKVSLTNGREFFSSGNEDARNVAPKANARANPCRSSAAHSEGWNVKSLGNTCGIPSAGMATDNTCARALSSVIQSSISSLSLSVLELKDLIRSGRENDFVKAMQAIIPTHENGDGGKWRAKWRNKRLRAQVVRSFEIAIEKMEDGKFNRGGGLELHFIWRDYGGEAMDKNLRNLLINEQ